MKGRRTWATNVRECLFRYGFGYAWFNQGVGRRTVFLKLLKARMIDCRWQNWNEHVENSERFSLYRTLIERNVVQIYLNIDVDKHSKFLMTRFRFGITDLKTHY